MSVSSWIGKFDEVALSVHKSKPLMVEEERVLSYGDLFDQVSRCGGLIASLGLKADDRVIVATRDSAAMVVLFLSFLRNGITSVILDPGASKIEVEQLAKTADAKAVFADAGFLERSGIREQLSKMVAYVTIAPEGAKDQGLLGRILGRRNKPAAETAQTFPALLKSQTIDCQPPADLSDDTIAYILFTSGTTSQPKGVEITHKNLFAQELTFVKQYGFDKNTQLLNVLPMHHTDGLTHGPVLAFFAGATLHRPLLQFRVDLLPHLLRCVYTLQITHFITVPAVLALMRDLEEELSGALATNDFRFVISTAAYLDPKLWQSMESRYGVRIVNVYGLTETVCEALYCGPDDDTRKIGTVGKPVDCEARVVDDDGDDVAQGDVGELLLKGDHIMRGYFRQPEETAKVLKQGWFYTGDLAKVDDEGFYHIAGRKKNVIITAGINVYPEDVTAVIRAMPGVLDAVSFGLEDETWGERVVSCVQTTDDGLTIEAIAAHCGESLAREKLPNKLFISPELPRGPAGKVIINEVKAWVKEEMKNQASIDHSGSIRDQVRLIAARIFNMISESTTMETNPDSATGWNSLAHVEFLLELEEHFKFKMGPREFMQIDKIGDAARLVEERALSGATAGDESGLAR